MVKVADRYHTINLCNREDMDVEDWAERATLRKKAEGGAGFSSKMRKFAEK